MKTQMPTRNIHGRFSQFEYDSFVIFSVFIVLSDRFSTMLQQYKVNASSYLPIDKRMNPRLSLRFLENNNNEMDATLADVKSLELLLNTHALDTLFIHDLEEEDGEKGYLLYFRANTGELFLLKTTRNSRRIFKTFDAVLSLLRDLGYSSNQIAIHL